MKRFGFLLLGGLVGACGSKAASDTSFRNDVVPILTANCTGNGACHGTPGGVEIYLAAPVGSASQTVSLLVNQPSTEPSSGMAYVTPGNPAESYLQFKIDGDYGSLPGCDDGEDGGPCGVTMPKSAGMLSDADRATIRSWISEGAPDN